MRSLTLSMACRVAHWFCAMSKRVCMACFSCSQQHCAICCWTALVFITPWVVLRSIAACVSQQHWASWAWSACVPRRVS